MSNRIIVSITERKEWQKGALFIDKDISFSDPAGDAITVINKVLSASLSGEIYDDIIQASAAEQKRGALVSSGFGCYREFEIVIEYRIFDAAGNLSAPEAVAFSCPAPKPYLNPSLIIGIVIGLILVGLAVWLLLRYRRAWRSAVTSA